MQTTHGNTARCYHLIVLNRDNLAKMSMILLPQFGGTVIWYSLSIGFEIFLYVVHNNESLPHIQKIHCLTVALEDVAHFYIFVLKFLYYVLYNLKLYIVNYIIYYILFVLLIYK